MKLSTSHAASRRVYLSLVFGALGGVTGWFVAAISIRSDAVPLPLALLAAHGAILGSLIGLFVGALDGVIFRSYGRGLKFGAIGFGLGLLGGALALPLAQQLYEALIGTDAGSRGRIPMIASGVVCWILFGGLIGLGEGIGKGSQMWKGLLGGMLGGLLGGTLYELVGRSAEQGLTIEEQQLLALAVCVLGGLVGSSIALVTNILKDAWLIIESGKLAGTEINVSKYVHPELGSKRPGIIGSSQWDANIYLPGDSGVLGRHASIGFVEGLPMFSALPEAKRPNLVTRVNDRAVTQWPLNNGDRIQVGETILTYRQRRR